MAGDGGPVPLDTAGDVADADRVVATGHREQVALQRGDQPGHRRTDALLDQLGRSVPTRPESRWEQDVVGERPRQEGGQLGGGLGHPDGGGDPPPRGCLAIPVGQGVEVVTEAGDASDHRVPRVVVGQRRDGDRLEHQCLRGQVPGGGGVGLPQAVVGVVRGRDGHPRQDRPVDVLTIGVLTIDVVTVRASRGRGGIGDAAEAVGGGHLRGTGQIGEQPVELGEPEQGRVERVVPVLQVEELLVQAGEGGLDGRGLGGGHPLIVVHRTAPQATLSAVSIAIPDRPASVTVVRPAASTTTFGPVQNRPARRPRSTSQ